MKLLMISGDRSVAAGKAGAFSETLKELCTHFERIDILCPRIPAVQQVRSLYGNVYLHPAPGGLLSQPLFIRKKGRELFALHRHDVMTIHDYPPFYNGIGARWLKRSIGIPSVLEIHHIIGWPRASSITERIGYVLSRLLLPSHCRKFEATRVVNATVQQLLTQWGVPERLVHVVSSVYLDHQLLASSKNQPKVYDLVFCARLVDNKGLLSVIDALEHMPDATLLVIGDGPLKKKAEDHARRFGTRVQFSGWLPSHADVLRAMASGKIFIMNSASEGGPRSALEAMALGLPVLATRVGVMPDIVKDGVNGFFIDGTASDIAAKATTLLSDPAALVRMSESAVTVKNRFEKKAAIQAYVEFLKTVSRI